MEEELRPYIEKYSITITRQYIDNNPRLVQMYGDKVPVLTLHDETLCEYFLDSDLLISAIETDKH